MDRIDELLLKESEAIVPLYQIILAIKNQAGSDLEFICRTKAKIKEFLQYTENDLELLKDELQISPENFLQFNEKLQKLLRNLSQFEPGVNVSDFVSMKNGIEFQLKYECCYTYIKQVNAKGYIFKIYEEGRKEESYFSFQLREMENMQDLKVIDMYPDNNKYYLGKGISIAIIKISNKIFQKRIISSSNQIKSYPGEFNSVEAIEKVWKPMVKMGLAKYNVDEDYFFTI